VLNEPDSTWEFLTSDDVDDIPGFKIFQSNKDDWTNVNDFSPIIYFLPNTTYTFCITGDSTTTKENWYLNSNLPAFTVKYYIIAHHGSGDSSSAQLLAQLRPQYTFYSSFDPNANYGHPHISTCQRIKVYTNEIYGTEYNGTISINDGQVNENLVLTTTAWTKKNGERIII
jgi:beta-lactamase superfamily II metal-dependent hydrolase